MKKYFNNQRGAIDIVLIIVVLALAAGLGGYVYYRQQQNNKAYNSAGSGATVTKHTKAKSTVADPYAGWKTYTSSQEKSSFKYPPNWKVAAKPHVALTDPNGDSFQATSPSGTINIYWSSFVDGLGGACVPVSTCPTTTYLTKTALAGDSSLSVFTAIATKDGTHYVPWIGVLNSSRNTGIVQDLNYDEFAAKNNGASATSVSLIFSTSGADIGPGDQDVTMTKAQAMAWFNSTEAQQAKLIFASYSY